MISKAVLTEKDCGLGNSPCLAETKQEEQVREAEGWLDRALERISRRKEQVKH